MPHSDLAPSNLLVFSLDDNAHAYVTAAGLTSVRLDTDAAHEQEAEFGTQQFNLLSKKKLAAVKAVLDAGLDVLFTDADVVWCRRAFPHVARLVDNAPADLLVQTAWPRSLLNSGFYYVRSNHATRALFNAFLTFPHDSENDQVIFNRVLCNPKFGGSVLDNLSSADSHSNHTPNVKRGPTPLGCRWRQATAHLFSPLLFPTGGEVIHGEKIFHLPRNRIMHMCDAGSPLVMHNNCILSNKKMARFVVKGIWYVNPAFMDGDDDPHADHTAFENDVVPGENSDAHLDLTEPQDLQRVCGPPVPPTQQMRRRCGPSKCGPDGDVHRFPHMHV
ncbi:unnamed protein product [Agarophyton chilense]